MRSQAIPFQEAVTNRIDSPYDVILVAVSVALVSVGLIMVASSSISVTDNAYASPLHYFWRQLISVGLGLSSTLNTPLTTDFLLSLCGPISNPLLSTTGFISTRVCSSNQA